MKSNKTIRFCYVFEPHIHGVRPTKMEMYHFCFHSDNFLNCFHPRCFINKKQIEVDIIITLDGPQRVNSYAGQLVALIR